MSGHLRQQSTALRGLHALSAGPATAGPNGQRIERTAASTVWQVQPSLVLDVLCFLNTLSGDPFYLEYYKSDYAIFAPRLTDKVRQALASIKRQIKDENGNIVSAFLCLHFSPSAAQTPDALIHDLDNRAPLQQALKRTPYYSEQGWRLFGRIQSDLRSVFAFLKDAEFESHWRQMILPRVQQRIKAIEPRLSSYNVVAADEAVLGTAFSSHTVTVYLLYYNQPHGIRLAGARFISNTSWPLGILVQNAAHELLHPPYNLKGDRELRDTLAQFQRDTFVMDKVTRHNRSFGYNSLESYLEENCVRALDQLVMEKLSLARDPRVRWKEEDEGMHVFAAALYRLMKEEQYPTPGETFRNFLVRSIRGGKLAPGRIRPSYEAFYRQ